jgi:hypothetical protein
MPFVDTNSLRVIERLPGCFGRYFHSSSMTFAHYEFTRGARSGMVAIVPAGVGHSVKALIDGRAIIVDHPSRPDFG